MKHITLLIIITILIAHPAAAQGLYTVDSKLDDWNVPLNPASSDKYYFNHHLPSGGNDIDVFTEDNAYGTRGTFRVWPGYSTGNRYDAEAMYFDNDLNYGYLAIVTGLPPFESDFPAGDIFLDTGKNQPSSPGQYQYAIDIADQILYEVITTVDVDYSAHARANPWALESGTPTSSDVQVSYDPLEVLDFPSSGKHYVLEASFPLAALDLEDGDFLWLHWTMKCGNDKARLKADIQTPPVPEPATVTLMLGGLGGLFFRRRQTRIRIRQP